MTGKPGAGDSKETTKTRIESRQKQTMLEKQVNYY